MTSKYNLSTKKLKLALFFSFLSVEVVSSSTFYSALQEFLGILKYNISDMKKHLVSLIIFFILALKASTNTVIINNTFIKNHEKMKQEKNTRTEDSKL